MPEVMPEVVPEVMPAVPGRMVRSFPVSRSLVRTSWANALRPWEAQRYPAELLVPADQTVAPQVPLGRETVRALRAGDVRFAPARAIRPEHPKRLPR